MRRHKFIIMLISILLAFFVAHCLSVKTEAASSGSYGDNSWTLDNNGLLTISGSHEMKDYNSNGTPWYSADVKSVVIKPGVTTIGNRAFSGCSNLTSVVIADSVTRIGEYAFKNCTKLTSIIIPNSVERIDKYAFQGCQELTSVTVGNMVKSIDSFAFSNCSSLNSITIPDSVESFGSSIFSGCSSLTTITIPDGITNVASGMFSGCNNLNSIVLPASITGIKNRAFYECDNLMHVFYQGTNTQWESINIGEDNPITDVTVHCSVAIGSCMTDAIYCPECDCCYLQDGTAIEHGRIVFKNWDGEIIRSNIYHQGDVVRQPSAPTKPADNTYTYAFAGWDKKVVACDGDATYTAMFTPTYIDYTVVFLNEDGAELSNNTYHYGDEVTAPAEPIKAADNTYTYAFAGWDKKVVACAGDTAYTATYTPIYIDYTVIFLNEDGTELSSNTYHYGDEVTAPAEPTKAADNTYTYAFAGWDKEVAACAGDTTYTATYTPTYIDYTIAFLRDDDSLISKTTYHYGDTIQIPEDLSKTADNIYSYTFSAWDKEIAGICSGDAVYTASYIATYVDYIVEFRNWNGAVVSRNTHHYGDAVNTPPAIWRPADKVFTYTFAGWDKEVTPCQGNTVYTAVYEETYIDYTVVFCNYDGSQITSNTYHYGDAVMVPIVTAIPEDKIYTYTFIGWDRAVTNCYGNTTYTADFLKTYINYTVTFQYEDGTVISSKTYHYGDLVEIPNDPVKAPDSEGAFTFVGWDKKVTVCEEDTVYTAVFNRAKHLPDYDGNGVVTDADAVYLLRHTLFPENYPLNGNGDVNNDGVVTDADAVYLLRHTLFPVNYPLYPGKDY